MGDLDKSQWEFYLSVKDEITLISEVPTLITGRDLIELGYKPGPRFKQVLGEIRALQDSQDLQTKEQALKVAVALMD